MNEVQRKLFEQNIDLAEVLAINATCREAEYDELQREAERALADAVVKYDKTKHGSFETFATKIIQKGLSRIVNRVGNDMFTTEKNQKPGEESFFTCAEEVIQAELDNLHRQLGY